MRSSWLVGLGLLGLVIGGCSAASEGSVDDEVYGANPFLADPTNGGKADTAYMNPDGREVEVDLEADVEAPAYKLAGAPAELGQFALTYLRKRGEFYLESLAEDATSDSRVEWLVDGAWITAQQAKSVASDKLRRWRIRGVNAVLLHSAADGVEQGQVFTAEVPIKPYSVMSDAADTCADPDGHMDLDASVYWYLWNPDKAACSISTQKMTVTLSKLLPDSKVVYPEYDQLVKDGKVTAVVLFGQIGDGALSENDIGMRGFREMSSWLEGAGFQQVSAAPLGRRFVKPIGGVDFEIDLYSPKEFSGLSDYAHFDNFQRALSEHEIVAYDGHSMLGASDFWSRPVYPQSYQIFLYGGCLGYEYYVAPILGGKGGWANLDLMSSVVEVSAGANEFAGPVLAKIAWALDNGYRASWRDLLVAVRQRVGDSTFGVSGVRDNCFSPDGSLCGASENSVRYGSESQVAIPDGSQTGATSTIGVPDVFEAKSVTLHLDVTHDWVGDLVISLEHDGTQVKVWDQTGGSKQQIQESFDLPQFAGKDASGTWKLRLIDVAKGNTGTLNAWALDFGK